MAERVWTEVADRIAKVTIDNTARHNALTGAMVHDLVETFDRLHHDPEVWVIILRAEGSVSFSSGRDLSETARSDAQQGVNPDALPMRGAIRNVFEVIIECGKPVIGAIFGNTLGGGAELALACDLRLAASDLRFGFPEVRRGFGANFAAAMLPRLIPLGVSNELLYTGRIIDAETAATLGLVNRVVDPATLDTEVEGFALELLRSAPLTIRRHKAMATRSIHLPLAAALRLDPMPDVYQSDDRREGVAAFMEKRHPRWKAK
ncbi:MAG: enoyl-CoA hydratase/isomerase family protein [Nocardioidaceae bacterium]|nr:enoyl-CoA hydratase/isomerase family protein [Nocardioidaceae bacterium]